jgi:hypothetical protein
MGIEDKTLQPDEEQNNTPSSEEKEEPKPEGPKSIIAAIYISNHRRERVFTELPKTMIGNPFVCQNTYCKGPLDDVTKGVTPIKIPSEIKNKDIKYGICSRCRTKGRKSRYFMIVDVLFTSDIPEERKRDRHFLSAKDQELLGKSKIDPTSLHQYHH